MTIHINYDQLQTNLSGLLNQVAAGETLIVSKDETPIAEIRPIDPPRPIGLARGQVTFSPAFHEPLPEDILAAFEGKDT